MYRILVNATVRQGLRFLRHALPDILANRADGLTPRMVHMIEELAGDLHHLDTRINSVHRRDRDYGSRRSSLPTADDGTLV